jgi:Tfp pilus assembly protein PilF
MPLFKNIFNKSKQIEKDATSESQHLRIDVKFSHICPLCSFTSKHYFIADTVSENGHVYLLLSDEKNKIKKVKLPSVLLKISDPEQLLLGRSNFEVISLHDHVDLKNQKTAELTDDRLDDLLMTAPCSQCGSLLSLIISFATAVDKEGRLVYWTLSTSDSQVHVNIVLLWQYQKDKYKVIGLFKPSSSENKFGNATSTYVCFVKSKLTDQKRVINLISEAFFFQSQKKYKDAIICYDNALKLNPKHAIAWQNKGEVLRLLGQENDAIQCFTEAISINPDLIIAWNDMGATLSDIGKYQEAFPYLDKAIDLAANWRRPWLNKGINHMRIGEFHKAIECLDKAIDIDQNYTTAWCNKGMCYASLKLYNSYENALKCRFSG